MNRIIDLSNTIDIQKISSEDLIIAKCIKTQKFVGFIRRDFYSQGYVLGFPNGNILGGTYITIKILIENLSSLYEFYSL